MPIALTASAPVAGLLSIACRFLALGETEPSPTGRLAAAEVPVQPLQVHQQSPVAPRLHPRRFGDAGAGEEA